MQPFEVQPDEGTINGPAAELKPTELLCQFPVIFPGSHIVLISMLHKFCSRMQAAGLKLTLIEKPRPRPTAPRRELEVQKETPTCCLADLSAFKDQRRDREYQDKANSPRGSIVEVWFHYSFLSFFLFFNFFFLFKLWSIKIQSISVRLFL